MVKILSPSIVIACLSVIVYIWYSFSPSSQEIYQEIVRSQVCQQQASPLPAQCYFSTNYFEAREKFLTYAKRISSAKHIEYVVQDKYVTDVVIIPGNIDSVAIQISGTHGPEGFAGSAIQSHFLHTWNPKEEDKYPSIVLIHALNPFGFANNRRYNEDNIDLNRNFLNDDRFKFVIERDPNFVGYVDMSFFLNPPGLLFPNSPFLNDVVGLGRALVALLKYGQQTIKKTLVSGNYFMPKGLGFGGFSMSKSAKNLISIVQTLPEIQGARNIFLVDVHTGLGPEGCDTLGYDSLSSSKEKFFPSEVDQDSGKIINGFHAQMSSTSADSALSGYELTVGTLSEDFCKEWLRPDLSMGETKICMSQEFGTINMILVGKSLVDENAAFQYKSTDQSLEANQVYGERLKFSFLVPKISWMENVIRRGEIVFQQGMASLQ